MKVKKFIVNTMAEGLEKVRKELGADAMILQTKKVTKSAGVFGFFKKEQLEIIAGVDPDVRKQPSDPVRPIHSPASLSEEPQIKQLLTELLAEKRNDLSHVDKSIPKEIEHIIDLLKKLDLPPELTSEMTDHLLSKWYREQEPSQKVNMTEWIVTFLSRKLEDISFGGLAYENKLVKLVGPTGVGKTTTIAKLAAEAVLKQKKQVAFITTDTYRIAAIEQLKTYASIFHAPLEVCYSAKDYQQAVEKFAHYDVIFVDTAGRNYRLEENIKELSAITQTTDYTTETFLVLALTTKVDDMREVYEQFIDLEIDRFLFTKVDETSNLRALKEMVFRYQKGIAYITNGQEVPDDMKEMTKELFIDIVLNEDRNNV